MTVFFNALSAIGTLLGAFAAWLSLINARQLRKDREVKLNVKIKDIAFQFFPDTPGNLVSIEIVNLSSLPVHISKISVKMHDMEEKAQYTKIQIAQPFVPLVFKFAVYGKGYFIMDGRYNCELVFFTNKKVISIPFTEGDQRLVYRNATPTDDWGDI